MENKILHLLQHTILFLGELQRRLAQLDKLKNLDESHAKEQIVQISADSIRLLHTLEPCLPYAITKFPEFKDFLLSCSDAIARIKKDNAIEGYNCDCKGCLSSKATSEHTSVEVRAAEDKPERINS